MRLEFLILIAVVLDLVIGDPRRFPHPVRFIAKLALVLEKETRKRTKSPVGAGVITACAVLVTVGGVTALLVYGARLLHPIAGHAVTVLVIYTALAARDMAVHSREVRRALASGDLASAREKVGMIVGRDTDRLDEGEITRAAVETVAENTADGLIAPLFFAVLFGPVGAMVYKAVNTLDSTFGYKNERYIRFGRIPARLDDWVNFVPARLTAACIVAASFLAGMKGRQAFRILLRDGRKNPSPNAGLSEAAAAGALNVQLGGMNYYFGEPSIKPLIGEPGTPLTSTHIRKANILMFVSYGVSLLLFLGVRCVVSRYVL